MNNQETALVAATLALGLIPAIKLSWEARTRQQIQPTTVLWKLIIETIAIWAIIILGIIPKELTITAIFIALMPFILMGIQYVVPPNGEKSKYFTMFMYVAFMLPSLLIIVVQLSISGPFLYQKYF